MTPEGKVKVKIKKRLKEIGARWHCPVQNGMGAPTVDFDGCIFHGCGFVIEAKAPGEKLTFLQQKTFNEVEAAGGAAFMIDDSDESWRLFERWVMQIKYAQENLS